MMKSAQVVLQATNISKVFSGEKPLEILKNVSLTVQTGQSISIIGKSGSGKSSLLHILGTLDLPTKGSVIFPQANTSCLQTIRSLHLGFVFQSFYLLEDYSLLDNILMPGRILRKKPANILSHALALLEQVDLLSKKDLPVKLLSGGEKQRTALARALCNDPDILLVDEPTGNLDPLNAKIVQTLLLDACKKHNKSLVLVTHDQEFASYSDEVFLLKEGDLSSAGHK
jgi:lipoprotein-releasing system ATP-binding protein